MRKWIKVLDKLPPENLVVETKLHDEKGVRNVQKLIRIKNLWFYRAKAYYYDDGRKFRLCEN